MGILIKVGEVYGRRMMTGYLLSKGERFSENRVRLSLQRVGPESHERRRSDTIDKTNPIPYTAFYFGHKYHLDQNEKLIRYGVTRVMMVDGYSGFIVSYATMPIKNNLIIYEAVYRYCCIVTCFNCCFNPEHVYTLER